MARCHLTGPNTNSLLWGSNPLSLAHVTDLPASKALHTGPYKSQVHKKLLSTYRKKLKKCLWSRFRYIGHRSKRSCEINQRRLGAWFFPGISQ
jgi:hypothetical protein